MAAVVLPHPAPSTIPVLPGHARANREGGLPKLPRHGQKFALAVLASVASRQARSRVRLAASPLLQGVRTFEQSAGRELQNVFLDGNFAPVTEEVSEENLQVVEGRIPEDFPSGMFVRNSGLVTALTYMLSHGKEGPCLHYTTTVWHLDFNFLIKARTQEMVPILDSSLTAWKRRCLGARCTIGSKGTACCTQCASKMASARIVTATSGPLTLIERRRLESACIEVSLTPLPSHPS